jgi:hypothetical protein
MKRLKTIFLESKLKKKNKRFFPRRAQQEYFESFIANKYHMHDKKNKLHTRQLMQQYYGLLS